MANVLAMSEFFILFKKVLTFFRFYRSDIDQVKFGYDEDKPCVALALSKVRILALFITTRKFSLDNWLVATKRKSYINLQRDIPQGNSAAFLKNL